MMKKSILKQASIYILILQYVTSCYIGCIILLYITVSWRDLDVFSEFMSNWFTLLQAQGRQVTFQAIGSICQ